MPQARAGYNKELSGHHPGTALHGTEITFTSVQLGASSIPHPAMHLPGIWNNYELSQGSNEVESEIKWRHGQRL